MKNSRDLRSSLWRDLQIPLLMLLMHALLIRFLANSNTIASIFAAGPHVPLTTLFLALTFLALRFTTIALLPGIIAARIIYRLLTQSDNAGNSYIPGDTDPVRDATK